MGARLMCGLPMTAEYIAYAGISVFLVRAAAMRERFAAVG
jgi:hypothetical protein